MNIAVFSCSLHPQSRSYVLAKDLSEDFAALEATVEFFDLRDYELGFCGAPGARNSPGLDDLRGAIHRADAIILAVPIYNFDVNAAAKNLIELTGKAWNDKLVGFVCAAGGRASYMSVMSVANSLMLDFRCLIVPRFVYALGDDFDNDRTPEMTVGNDDIRKRLTQLAETTVKLAGPLRPLRM
ncbi:MAG: NAD(P)H-dependent oxidoreductase [Candidatus Poribacteria bacterium]|nr:NAD(P)H-dependent oxidoreductase [Candidatus Poribacteria bacterium]